MTKVINYNRKKFEHTHIQRGDDIKTQGEGSHLASQGERSRKDSSLMALSRNQPCKHFDLGLLATSTLRKYLLLKPLSVWSSVMATLVI